MKKIFLLLILPSLAFGQIDKKKAFFILNQTNSSPCYSPSELGADLIGWYERDGLVNNSTTANGIVASGLVSQLSDLSGNGNHFIEIPVGVSATATKPTFAADKLTFTKASNNSLYSPSLLSAIVGLSGGEIIVCFKPYTGINSYPLGFGELASTNKRSALGLRELGSGTDKTFVLFRDSPSSVQQLDGNVIPEGLKLTISFSSDGSAYKVVHEYDGERLEETLTVTSGSNNGNWFSDIVPDYIALFSFLGGTDVFHSGDLEALIIVNRQLTIQERSDMFCYLNNKYQVWP